LVAILFRGYREEIRRSDKLARGKSTRFMLKFSGVNGLVGLGAGFIIPLIPTWLFLKFGVLDTFSGPLWAVANLTIAFAAAASARLSKRFGHVAAIVMTQSLSMAFMVSITFMPDVYVASALFVVRTAAMNMSVPIMDSYLMSIITKDERGLASAINSLFWRLPNSVTTIAGGYLLQAGYLDLPFLIAALFYIVAIVLFYAIFKDVRHREDEL
ncbi:MAG: MFS transporter, partial [Thermoplasmata archaeon]|nr:MFS transporter [Thermoplasmata archaeon]